MEPIIHTNASNDRQFMSKRNKSFDRSRWTSVEIPNKLTKTQGITPQEWSNNDVFNKLWKQKEATIEKIKRIRNHS